MSILDQLKAPIVTLNLSFEYGREEQIKVGLLTAQEWEAEMFAVPNPPVPKVIASAGKSEPDFYHPDYQEKAKRAEVARNLRRIARALLKGGNELPGATFDEQVENLNGALDVGIYQALVEFLGKAVGGGKVTPESFQGDGNTKGNS